MKMKMKKKKVLSSILVGTMLISSIGVFSAFADEPETVSPAVVENVGKDEVKTSKPSRYSAAYVAAKDEINKALDSAKNYTSIASDYVVNKAKAAVKEVSENKVKYAIIAGTVLTAAVAGCFGYKALQGAPVVNTNVSGANPVKTSAPAPEVSVAPVTPKGLAVKPEVSVAPVTPSTVAPEVTVTNVDFNSRLPVSPAKGFEPNISLNNSTEAYVPQGMEAVCPTVAPVVAPVVTVVTPEVPVVPAENSTVAPSGNALEDWVQRNAANEGIVGGSLGVGTLASLFVKMKYKTKKLCTTVVFAVFSAVPMFFCYGIKVASSMGQK